MIGDITKFFSDWNIISSVSNITMAAIAFVALGYSIKQNYDLKKQKQEEERGRLFFSFVISDKCYHLKIENIGNLSVYNLNFSVNKNFLDLIIMPALKDYLKKATLKNIHIAPHTYKLYTISPIEGINKDIDQSVSILKYTPIEITGIYNRKYKINERFTMDEFTGSMIISDPIITELSNINKSIIEIGKLINK